MYTMPPEFAPHAGVWLAWPHNLEHWPGNFDPIPAVVAEMVGALAASEKVYVCVNDDGEKAEAKLFLEMAGIINPKSQILNQKSESRIEFVVVPNNSSWLRDIGPIFVRDEAGRMHASLWRFTAWGNKYQPYDLDAEVNKKVAAYLKMPTVDAGMVLEGGSIDVNGKGSLLTSEQCLLNKNRNPDLSKAQIEAKLHEFLGATNVLWLGEGIVGDDTDGHIDDIARFVSPTSVVTVVEDNKNDENYALLQDNLQRLEKMRDQDGKQFTIATLPMPDPVVYEGQRLPASYANFYIGNTVILVPTFRQKKDEVALAKLQGLFPERKVVGLDSVDFVWGLGTVHCSTQQLPK